MTARMQQVGGIGGETRRFHQLAPQLMSNCFEGRCNVQSQWQGVSGVNEANCLHEWTRYLETPCKLVHCWHKIICGLLRAC